MFGPYIIYFYEIVTNVDLAWPACYTVKIICKTDVILLCARCIFGNPGRRRVLSIQSTDFDLEICNADLSYAENNAQLHLKRNYYSEIWIPEEYSQHKTEGKQVYCLYSHITPSGEIGQYHWSKTQFMLQYTYV